MLVSAVMKTMITFCVLLGAVGLTVYSQEKPSSGPKNANTDSAVKLSPDPFIEASQKLIRVQVEHIDVSHKDLTRLMMEDTTNTANAKALRMRVQELVEKESAKVIDTQIIVGKNEKVISNQSVSEYIYPVEYEPPDFPEKLSLEILESGVHPVSYGIPVSFETRNLGSDIETVPTISSDGKTIDLPLQTNLTWHTGNTSWSQLYKIEAPNFYTVQTKINLSCIPGQYVLISAVSPKNAEGKLDTERKVMVFLKCDLLAVVP